MIKAFGPKRLTSFRDNYLALLITGLALFFTVCANAQGVDTTKPLQRINAYGFDYFGIRSRGFLVQPNDTPKLKVSDSGAVAVVGGTQFIFNGYYWKPGGGSTNDFTTSAKLKLRDSVSISVPSVSALRALPFGTYANGKDVQVQGYYSVADGGGGLFKWDPAGGANGDDGGTAIIPTGGGSGAFVRSNNVTRPYLLKSKEFGLKGDGVTNETSLLNNLIAARAYQNANYYNYPLDISLSGGTYLFTMGSVNSMQVPIHFHGDGMGQTIIKFVGNGTFLQPGSANKNFSFDNLTVDFNGTTSTAFDLSGGVAQNTTFDNVEFLNVKGTGISISGDNVTVTNCWFYGNQNYDSLNTTNGIRLIRGNGGRIANNHFFYMDLPINIGGSLIYPTSVQQYVKGTVIENNQLISWWFYRPARASALTGTAQYISKGHTNPQNVYCRQALVVAGKNFASYSIPLNTTIRVSDTVYHVTSGLTFGAGVITAPGSLSAYKFRESDYVIIKDLTNGFNVFATISTDTSATNKIYFSNPLDATTFQPVKFPLTNMASYDVSVLRVVATANIADINGDTLFFPYFTSRTGDTTLPSSTKPYAVLMNHGSHGIMLNPSATGCMVSNNHLYGGWADQINPYGAGNSIIDNEVVGGEDVGITIEGDHTTAIGNKVRKQGSTGIYAGQGVHHSIFSGNEVRDVQTVNVGADALLSGMAVGGSNNIVADNIIEVKDNVNMNYGFTLFSGDSNLVHHNNFNARLYPIRVQDFQGDSCKKNTLESNLGYTFFINSPDNYVSGLAHSLVALPNPDSLYGGKIFMLPSGSNADAYLETRVGGVHVWDKLQNQAAVNNAINAKLPFFGGTFYGDGSVGFPYNVDTVYDVATKYDLTQVTGSGLAYVAHDSTLKGLGTTGSPLKVDTSAGKIATQSYVDNKPGGGISSVVHDNTMTGNGTSGSQLKVDTSGGKIATQTMLNTGLATIAPDGSETKVSPGSGISVSGSGTTASPYVVTASGTPTSNPFNALTVLSYGAVANATVPAGRDTSIGIDLGPSLRAAMTAAADGQVVIVPPGQYSLQTPLDTVRNKRVILYIYGTIHCNKRTFLRIYPATSGNPYKNHDIRIYGELIGQENLPTHDKTSSTHTGPTWSALAGAAIETRNQFRNHFEINRISGFYYGVVNYVDKSGAFGGQENSFAIQIIEQCSVDFAAISLDGDTYWDKNTITGINGGTCRFAGGTGIVFDGFPGAAASSGEIYNGAFRANKFQNVLFERLDTGMVLNGEVTETFFDHLMIEGGSYTGMHTDNVFQMRNVSPNYVRGTTFISCEYIYQRWLNNATFGINGKFVNTPFYTASSTLIGYDALIDASGNLVIQASPGLPQSAITTLPSIVKLVTSVGQAQDNVTASASPYNIPLGVKYLAYTTPGGTVILPAASGNYNRDIYVKNSSGGVINITNSDITQIGIGQGVMLHCTGTQWQVQGAPIYPPYRLGYSQTSTVQVTNTASKTSILSGGGQTFSNLNLSIGDYMLFTGKGTINMPTGLQGTSAMIEFATGSYTTNVTTVASGNSNYQNTTVGEPPRNYEYEIKITPQGTGTNVSAIMEYRLYLVNENSVLTGNVLRYTTNITGFNAVSPTWNMSITWSSATTAYTWNSLVNKAEIFRQ